jgi:ATP-dependent NAD(P)H-hydrate dehydratase
MDIITDGNEICLIKNEGSRKRCGGIGDILTGILAANLAIYKKRISEAEKSNLPSVNISNKLLVICAVASFICRETAKLAFINKGISLTAPDVIEEIHNMLKIVNPFNPLN